MNEKAPSLKPIPGVGGYPVLGPQDLLYDDMARILGDVLGKPIVYGEIPIDAYRSQLLGYGMSEAFVSGLAEMFEAKAKGLDSVVPRPPEAATPTTFAEWAERHLKPAISASQV